MMNSQETNPLALRSIEALPNNGDPFWDCRLDRIHYAEILTNIVLTYHRGFVLALSSDWGTGKTFFVKRWKKHLEHKEIQSIYFNAWENDFDNNALIALLAELQSVVLDQNRELYEKLIEKTSLIVKRILPTTIKLFSKILLSGEDISEILKELTAASLTTTSDSINDYIQKKKDIQDFKEALSAFVQSTNQDKPLVIFIDELDRCRPDYAVEVLEAVKHLFNIDGIVFVLSIDKKHLASSIKGYYGSEHINTDEYLRRFIDLEYTLPEPSIEKFCGYLYDKHNFVELHADMSDKSDVLYFFTMYSQLFNAKLRQLEKINLLYFLSSQAFGYIDTMLMHCILLLIFMKSCRFDLYEMIVSKKFTFDQLNDKLRVLFHNVDKSHKNHRYYLNGVVLLMLLYLNQLSNDFSIKSREAKVQFFEFHTKEWNGDYHDAIVTILKELLNVRHIDYDLNKILHRIELLDNLS